MKFFGIFILSMGILTAQTNPDIKRTWHWYFGNGAGLDFSTGTAVADTNGKLHSYESCAAISDTAGNLLFYTDGDTVWDRLHNVMPNGTGLMGCTSSLQGAIIVPHPNSKNDSIFYLFTADCFENMGVSGYRYHIIDVKNNTVMSKNNLLYAPCTEGMAITKHANGIDYWLMTHEYNTNRFLAYKIDDTLGLVNTPVTSAIGEIIFDYIVSFCFSPNGKKLAVAFQGGYLKDQLFDFDNNLGILYNVINLGSTDSILIAGAAYDVAFSPDNSKIYCSSIGSYIYQYCLTGGNDSASISKTFNIVAFNGDNSTFGQLQLSPNNKILIASYSRDSISSIEYPNLYGNQSNILVKNLFIQKTCELGLPTFPDCFFYQPEPPSSCDASTTNNTSDSNNHVIFYLPNIFTPNADNINDYYTVQIAGYTFMEYSIFNRWGNLIYQGKQELNPEIKTEVKLWNGTYQGHKVPSGVYFSVIKITNKKGETEIKKNFIQVLY